MESSDQYAKMVAACETVAKNRGHTLGVWQPVDERLQASMCEVCGAIAWVTRYEDERGWQAGGEALRRECSEEEDTTEDWSPAGA